MKHFLLPAALAGLLIAPLPATAMSPAPMVGGPCTYETAEVTATVTAVQEGAALLKEDGTEIVFDMPLTRFGNPPEIGQQYSMAKRYIVKGTCTPYSYMLGSRIDSSEDQPPVSAE